MIDPNKLVIMRDGGTANMGDLSFKPADTEARFSIPGEAFALVFLRIHFASGSGSADVVINVDSRHASQFDTALYTLNARGVGVDVNFRVPEDELAHWVFQAGDVMVLTWTNPASGTTSWGAEVGLIGVSDIA